MPRSGSGRCHGGALDSVAIHGFLDKAVGLLLRQCGRSRAASAGWRTHRLLDDHEAAWQQAQSAQALRIGLQLLLHAGGQIRLACHEIVDHSR